MKSLFVLFAAMMTLSLSAQSINGNFWVKVPYQQGGASPIVSIDQSVSSAGIYVGSSSTTVASLDVVKTIVGTHSIYVGLRPQSEDTIAQVLKNEGAEASERLVLKLQLRYLDQATQAHNLNFATPLTTAPSSLYASIAGGARGDFKAEKVTVAANAKATSITDATMTVGTATLSGNLTINGTLTLSNGLTLGSVGFPIGAVIYWSNANAIPEGWTICNGENGTVDLRGRFVMGSPDMHSVNAEGGEATHTLTLDEMPKHFHNMSSILPYKYDGRPDEWRDHKSMDEHGYWTGNQVPISANVDMTGGGQPHENRPPYRALIYIQRIF